MEWNNYEIRIESIGGFGANVTGSILGETGAVYMGVEASSFASYGSEKRGSPVKSYVRYSKNEIRINAPVRNPDLLALFKISLADNENALTGIDKNTDVVINTDMDHSKAVKKCRLPSCRLWLVDAVNIAHRCSSRINMVMLGAIARASGIIPFESVKSAVENTIGIKYPQKLENNLKALKEGFDAVTMKEVKSDYPYREYRDIERAQGYDNSPIGGVNTLYANAVTNNTEGAREGYLPHYIRERCIDCGLCDVTCPDMVFQFKDGKNMGMDLYHCKGCLRCVEICPAKALVAAKEGEHYDNVGNIHLVNKDFEFNFIGENSWVDSESENNEL